MNRQTIYIASSWLNRGRISKLFLAFQAEGFTVHYDWTDNPLNCESEKAQIAVDEYTAVSTCDIFLLTCPIRKGAPVEFGIALASWERELLYEQPKKLIIVHAVSRRQLRNQVPHFYALPPVEHLICPDSELPLKVKELSALRPPHRLQSPITPSP